jgi:hypothetical protein
MRALPGSTADVVPRNPLLGESLREALEQTRSDHPRIQAADRAREADLDAPEQQELAGRLQRDVVDPNHLASLRVDDLAVEDVALQTDRLDCPPLHGDGPSLDEHHAAVLRRERENGAPRHGPDLARIRRTRQSTAQR